MDYSKAWLEDLEQAYRSGDKQAAAELKRRREAGRAEMKIKNATSQGTVTGIAPRGYADWGGDGNEDGTTE